MENDVYRRLAHHLDNLPGGFPSTESGVELRILRRLFTPEEADLSLYLSLIPEETRVIARRAKISKEDAYKFSDSKEELDLALKGIKKFR